jgi:hypothetical protein
VIKERRTRGTTQMQMVAEVIRGGNILRIFVSVFLDI